jgi:phosphatidylserine/phosphatidylglycerophosphate/cardiolipin synthase-like enzyme
MQALTRAADRGVKVRMYLDGTQFAEREPTRVFQDLAQTPGVEIHIKRSHGAPMHAGVAGSRSIRTRAF